MLTQPLRFSLLIICISCFSVLQLQAQPKASVVSLRPRLLKGTWQLTQTFALGSLHQVNKADYDCIMGFRPFHRYYEEVMYESNHWVITGKWHLDRKKKTLRLTNRQYVIGKLEDHPADIIYEITEADGKTWTGSSTAKGQPVKVGYTRIPTNKKKRCPVC